MINLTGIAVEPPTYVIANETSFQTLQSVIEWQKKRSPSLQLYWIPDLLVMRSLLVCHASLAGPYPTNTRIKNRTSSIFDLAGLVTIISVPKIFKEKDYDSYVLPYVTHFALCLVVRGTTSDRSSYRTVPRGSTGKAHPDFSPLCPGPCCTFCGYWWFFIVKTGWRVISIKLFFDQARFGNPMKS